MKLTTKQLKQIIKEELQYLYEDEQGSVSDEEIANLFLIGKDDFETMQVLMEDLFGSMNIISGKDYFLSNEDTGLIAIVFSDSKEFLQRIHKAIPYRNDRSAPVYTHGVYEVRNYFDTGDACKENWNYLLEIEESSNRY